MNLVLNSGYRYPIMQDDSLILIKPTSSRVWSWWPIPIQNNGIHSTGYYAGGIFHTQTTLPLLTFCSTGCMNVHTRGNISSAVSQNVMKHQGSGTVKLENKEKCTKCKTKFHSPRNSGDYLKKRKIVPAFSVSNENGSWITKVFNFDTKWTSVVGSALRPRYLNRKTPIQ